MQLFIRFPHLVSERGSRRSVHLTRQRTVSRFRPSRPVPVPWDRAQSGRSDRDLSGGKPPETPSGSSRRPGFCQRHGTNRPSCPQVRRMVPVCRSRYQKPAAGVASRHPQSAGAEPRLATSGNCSSGVVTGQRAKTAFVVRSTTLISCHSRKCASPFFKAKRLGMSSDDDFPDQFAVGVQKPKPSGSRLPIP